MRQTLITVALLSALFAAVASPAAALPGDPPIELLDPAPDAIVPASPNGLVVGYTCPVYRYFDDGEFQLRGDSNQYGALLATSPETGTDNRLRQDMVVAQDQAR